MWGGTEESEAISTIHAALDKGINLIDTAPVYGFGALRRIGWPGTCGRQERRRDHRHQGWSRLGKRQDPAQLFSGSTQIGA
ncbi:MAG: aldo/keto reductase [Burkholderiaceae bacterium]